VVGWRMDERDRDKILHRVVRRIADDLGCTIDDVNRILDSHPLEVDRDRYLKRTLALQLLQLDEIEEAFHDKAIVDCDVAAGVLLIKAQERRATLLGANAPLGHVVRVVQPPAHRETSTDKLERALNALIEDQRREQANGSNGQSEPH
jgi:hypothetical protein